MFTNFSKLLIFIGVPFNPLMQCPTHCSSTGQIVEQISLIGLFSWSIKYASMNLFSLILEINSGIQVSIGQPFLHIGVLQFKHLFASFKMLSISSNFIKSFLGILAYILYMFLHTKIKIFPKNILIFRYINYGFLYI